LFRLLEKLERVKPSVGGGRWSVTAFVGGIFERVTGAVADFNVDSLSRGLHAFRTREPCRERSPDRERRRFLAQGHRFPEYPRYSLAAWAVIHEPRSEPRLMNRELNRQAAAHGPPERTNVIWVHIRAIGEIVKCRFQNPYRAVLPKTAPEFASFRRNGHDFASVEIHGKRDVPIRRQFHSLFLHPFVQTAPFMNDDYRSMTPRITREGEKSRNFLCGALECHGPRFRSISLTRFGR